MDFPSVRSLRSANSSLDVGLGNPLKPFHHHAVLPGNNHQRRWPTALRVDSNILFWKRWIYYSEADCYLSTSVSGVRRLVASWACPLLLGAPRSCYYRRGLAPFSFFPASCLCITGFRSLRTWIFVYEKYHLMGKCGFNCILASNFEHTPADATSK